MPSGNEQEHGIRNASLPRREWEARRSAGLPQHRGDEFEERLEPLAEAEETFATEPDGCVVQGHGLSE